MKYLISALFFIPGVINFIPIIGVISNHKLSQLYQIDGLDGDLALLLRHRAILFGIVGSVIMLASFQPPIRGHATIAGLVSMVSFVVLVFALKTSNPSLVKVAWVDVGATVLLVTGCVLHYRYQ